jgi:hypothetical protein
MYMSASAPMELKFWQSAFCGLKSESFHEIRLVRIWRVESASAFRGMLRGIRGGGDNLSYAIQYVLTLLEAKHDDIAVANVLIVFCLP